MRILLVSYYFPPYNNIGAVRVGKTAKFLEKLGHEIKVLSCGKQTLPKNLPLEISSLKVSSTGWFNVNAPVEFFLGGSHKVAEQGFVVSSTKAKTLLGIPGNIYKNLFNFPDGQIGWLPFALREANTIVRKWRPDMIYASAMPITSLIIAYFLAQKYNIPWIGELRDLWLDNHNRLLPNWRRRIETRMEAKIFNSSSGFVTVSKPLAEILRKKVRKPVEVITNGFDEEDYPKNPHVPFDGGRLNIVYTGRIYEGKQDLLPLLRSLKYLKEDVCKNIKIHFYGRYLINVKPLSRQMKVEEFVDVHSPVSYLDSLKIQSQADVLLFLLWQDENQKGVFTGKLFEYLGAKRPILAIGSTKDVASNLINQYGCGVVEYGPEKIAQYITRLYLQKQQLGEIPYLDGKKINRFSRKRQTKILADFIATCLLDPQQTLFLKNV